MRSHPQNAVNQKIISLAWLSFMALLVVAGVANWALAA